MQKDMDKIQFESRVEIGELIAVLEEWQKEHPRDGKNENVQKMINLLDVMAMEW